jgi:arginine deiminase
MSKIYADSEVNSLQRLIIHSPDSGLGKVVPSKAQDWLFEDIIHLETMRTKEYDVYLKILLYFLDPSKVAILNASANRNAYKPNSDAYFKSGKVIEFEQILAEVLEIPNVKTTLIAAVSAIEECSYMEMTSFLNLKSKELANLLITGLTKDNVMYFPPIPNLIFTRDIGIVIHDHLLLNKPAKDARTRESLLAKYVFFNHPYFEGIRSKIIEIEEDEEHLLLPEDKKRRVETLEGGDVMMIAPGHLLIGISERTSLEAAKQVMEKLFEKGILSKVTLIKIPSKRDYMHIDTVFTQIKKNVWVILSSVGKKKKISALDEAFNVLKPKIDEDEVTVKQFIYDGKNTSTRDFQDLEDLLTDISVTDLKSKEAVKFVYSGNDEFPYGAREQWTDSCNLLVIKEGVAIGYDRNDKTSIAFQNAGFKIIKAVDLISDFENNVIKPEEVENTIILLPSAELSRARGGSHCMSMPLERLKI